MNPPKPTEHPIPLTEIVEEAIKEHKPIDYYQNQIALNQVYKVRAMKREYQQGYNQKAKKKWYKLIGD